MKLNSSFDDQIKGRLGSYEPEVPAHVWENIMAEKKKEGPFSGIGSIKTG